MATFTSVGDSVTLSVTERVNLLVSISGTYNMTIVLQREVGSPGSGVWTAIREYKTPNATVSDSVPHSVDVRETYRLIVVQDTSGTATATLTSSAISTPPVTEHTHTVDSIEATGTPSSSTFLRGDGAWVEAGSWGDIDGTLSDQTDLQSALDAKSDSDHSHSNATTGAAGFMSATDKTKLDGIESSATADQTNAEIETAYNAQVSAASQAEAEAGSESAIRRWSPLRVAQAIAALSTSGLALTDHVSPASGNLGSDDYNKFVVSDQNLTVPNSWAAEKFVWIYNENNDLITLTVTSGTINALSSIQIPSGGIYFFWCRANAGTEPELVGTGNSNEAQTMYGNLLANGKTVSGNLAVVESDSGTLDDTQSGKIIVTSGNITIPTTTGFNCTLIAGGAHTVTFNSTTSAAMASGDIMSLVVQSSTVIHAVLTASANKVAFS